MINKVNLNNVIVYIVVGVIIGVIVLIIGGIISLFWNPRTSPIPPVTPTITPSPTPPLEPTPTLEPATPMPTEEAEPPTPIPLLPSNITSSPTPNPTLYDDFNIGLVLDPSKWILPDNENRIYQADGVLNLIKAQPGAERAGERLRATGAGRPIREMLFTITLKSVEGSVSGGAGLAVCLANGKRVRMDVGPGPNNGTGFEFSIYRKPPCVARDYSEEEHPVNEYFQPHVPTPIRVVWTGKELQFYINNTLKLTEPADASPITEFLFYMYAEPGSIYHVTVDDVHVVYAD